MFKCGNAGDNDASDIRLLFVFAVVAIFFFFFYTDYDLKIPMLNTRLV